MHKVARSDKLTTMSDSLAFRALRFGLRTASRAGGSVVERVLRGSEAPPFEAGARRTAADPREPVEVRIAGKTVMAARGATVLEVANQAAIDLRSYCGGNCSCGSCRIEIKGGANGLSKRAGLEEMVLGPDATRRGDRLACQAQILGPVEIHIPDWF